MTLRDPKFLVTTAQRVIIKVNKEMLEHASNLEFEEAAKIRDKIRKIKSRSLGLIINQKITLKNRISQVAKLCLKKRF